MREIWNKVTWWHYQTNCDLCNNQITSQDARYFCKECKYSVCMECSARLLSKNGGAGHGFMPPTAPRPSHHQEYGPNMVQPGDIFLCGPDKWGIHHCVMSIGQMRPSYQSCQAIIKEMPELGGMDFFSCDTIESSRTLKGQEIIWYPAKSYFARNRQTKEAFLVADVGIGTDTLVLCAEPVKVKLLMHPLRSGHGGPAFDLQAFRKALEVSAEASQHWSIKTAVQGFMTRRESQGLDPKAYPDPQSRIALMQDLEKRWKMRPICTSVAIMVWQRYFQFISGSGPEATDVAAQHILRWMPLLSDKTLPSALIKELCKCGWMMRGNLDA